MIKTLILVILSFLISSCITDKASVAPKSPWYTTNPNLIQKEIFIEARTSKLVTPDGLLLYRAYLQNGAWTQENYLKSHDLADLPAWQGYLMAAYAFKESITKEDQDTKISHLTNGLLHFYTVTGQPGLLGRSLIPGYQGVRLPWMDQGKWIQGPDGTWWRNSVAKDHVNLAIFGCSIPLSLERLGNIQLSDQTRQKLISLVLPFTHRLIQHNFRLMDWDGKETEYGDLSPQIGNGFNQMLVLHMLRTASFYDANIASLYRDKLKSWSTPIALSLEAVGESVKKIGKQRAKLDKPSFSDMQAMGLAYLSLALQETDRHYMKDIRRGMTGLWEFMRYERNPMFAFPYVGTIRSNYSVEDIIEDLRDFPMEKYEVDTGRDISSHIQPLANRPYNSNYWKSNPFMRIKHLPPPRTTEPELAGMDYLLSYWMGRYFNLIPAE